MKLISLNTWGGKIYKPLINFIQKNSKNTDIFCFQEVFKTTSNVSVRYNIKTTRNKLFPGDEKFADYIFISKGINVKNFEVPDIKISDHLPMILKFS